MFDDFLASVGGVAGFCAVVTLLLKVFPSITTSFSTWFYGHIDPLKLPYGSPLNKHWEQTRELSEQVAALDKRSREDNSELRKDTIKNTLIMLINDTTRNHSEAVRYELSKLEALDSDCWVVDAARKYLIENETN